MEDKKKKLAADEDAVKHIEVDGAEVLVHKGQGGHIYAKREDSDVVKDESGVHVKLDGTEVLVHKGQEGHVYAKKEDSDALVAETAAVGLAAGILGTLLGVLLLFPFNAVVMAMIGASGVAKVAFWHPIVLILSALGVTILAGMIPAVIAAEKDPAKVLRSH